MHIKKHFVYHFFFVKLFQLLLLPFLVMVLSPPPPFALNFTVPLLCCVVKRNTKYLLLLCIYLLFIECNALCHNNRETIPNSSSSAITPTTTANKTNKIKEYRMPFANERRNGEIRAEYEG